MPDKPDNEKQAKRKASPPNQPPKELPQDYSSLPQKPIKLKSDVSLPPALKRTKSQSRKAEQSTPRPAKRSKRKTGTESSRTLQGLSAEAKKIATAAAAEEGLELTLWLEQLILAHQQGQEQMQTLASINQSLQLIEQRLERLEDQRGFWSRFWDQFMEPYRK